MLERISLEALKSFKKNEGIEAIFIEINLRKSKWRMLATYKPPDHSKEEYSDFILKLKRYEKYYFNGRF